MQSQDIVKRDTYSVRAYSEICIPKISLKNSFRFKKKKLKKSSKLMPLYMANLLY